MSHRYVHDNRTRCCGRCEFPRANWRHKNPPPPPQLTFDHALAAANDMDRGDRDTTTAKVRNIR